MNKQQQIIKEERELGQSPLSQAAIYIDDMLGDLRYNRHLDALFSRGRQS